MAEHERFAAAAQKLAGIAGAGLGWTPGQYWNATPAELAAIFSALDGAAEREPNASPLDKSELNKLKETLPDAKHSG